MGLDLNVGMITVARSLPPVAGGPVEWHEGSALAMPFADASFDLVLCQQGLQFFPDRPAGLREMYRVLALGGRLALSVWRPIQHNPFHAAMAAALVRYVGAQAATSLEAAFSLGNTEELQALLRGAGFRDLTIRPATRTHRVGSPHEFIPRWLSGSPRADAWAQANEGTRAALISHILSALRTYIGPDGLAFPKETHLAAAHT